MSIIDQIDDKVYSFATLRQQELIDAVRKHGSINAAAKALDYDLGSLHKALKRAVSNAARKGYSPNQGLENPYPDGFKMGKTTIQRGPSGQIERTWERMCADNDKQNEMFVAAVESASKDIPRLKPVKQVGKHEEELANFYTITDYHIGMLAWRREGGADWDIKIAEEMLIKAFSTMIAQAPKAKTAIINQMGDFLHFDGLVPVTPTNRHVLDADSRFPKLVEVAIRALRIVIDMCLYAHEQVHVICAEGNHDLASAHWLQNIFSVLYENDPRVTVDQTPKPFYCYQHGKTMIGVTHGHCKHTDSLPLLFASEFPKVWGSTVYRYSHEGHRHHKQVKEHSGMVREMHQTLAARDSHASRGGYHSERSACCITYSKAHGEVGRVSVRPEMLQEVA